MDFQNKLFYLFFTGFIVLAQLSCKRTGSNNPKPTVPQDSTSKWTTYTIPAGGHYALEATFKAFDSASLHFDLTFDSSAIYTSVLAENQYDWNKVIGFSDCTSHHQQNSIRLAWRWNPAVGIELSSYKYLGGVRSFTILDTLQISDTVNVQINKEPNIYTTRLNNETYQNPRGCAPIETSYLMYPYFGGDETAPDTVRIHIRWLDA